MNSSVKTTRLYIPHSYSPDCKIVGDLEQIKPNASTQGRKIVLILHGTMGHKDYLYQRRLAKALPVDSFRFDFRGAHETGGTWKMAAFEEDIEDLEVVASYLSKEFGYVIDTVVSHSRGSIVAFRWICTSENGRKIRGFINVSGRYRMERIRGMLLYWKQLKTINKVSTLEDKDSFYQPYFESQGYYDWKVVVAQKEVVGRIFPEDVEKFATWDITPIKEKFPQHIHVLTIHGLQDKAVPPYDALLYARLLGRRNLGTHNLCIIEEADHNFSKHKDEVVTTCLSWWSLLSRDSLKTGIWDDDYIKGRL